MRKLTLMQEMVMILIQQVDEFLGCDVVLDADQTLDDVNHGDDLDTFDQIDNTDNANPTNVVVVDNIVDNIAETVETIVEQVEPSIANVEAPPVVTPVVPPFGSFTDDTSVLAPPVDTLLPKSPGVHTRRRGRSQDVNMAPGTSLAPLAPLAPALAPATNSTPTRLVVIALSASATAQLAPSKNNAIVDEDGFTKVVYRKSPSRQSPRPARPALLKRLQ